MQFFRRQAFGQLVFKPREIAEIVDRIGKRAFDQHDFAVIFAVFDFAVADALAFPQHVGFGQIHQTPHDRHFRRTDSLVFFFGLVPVIFVTQIHIIVGNFRRQHIFRQRAVGPQAQVVRGFDHFVAVGNHVIENFNKTHVLFKDSAFVQNRVFGIAAATENAEAVFAEFAGIAVVVHPVFKPEIHPLQLQRGKIAALTVYCAVKAVVVKNIILNIFRIGLFRTAGRTVTRRAAENAAVFVAGFAGAAAEDAAVFVTAHAGTAAENAAVAVFLFLCRFGKQLLPGRHFEFVRTRRQRIGNRFGLAAIAVFGCRLNTSAGLSGFNRFYLRAGTVFAAPHLRRTGTVFHRLRTGAAARTLSGSRQRRHR